MTAEVLRSRSVVHAMAMPFVVDVFADDSSPVAEAAAHAAVDAVERDLMWADGVFSLWRDHTPMAGLARGDISLGDCPPAVAQVLDECERWESTTAGAFRARRPDGILDPTGLVKAWAVQRAARHLDALGARGWMIGAAGDVLVGGVGPRPDGSWHFGIADPRHAENPQEGPSIDAVVLEGERTALCTSGVAQHGEHLWNAVGEMRAAYAQASVIGGDIVACDVWATAIAAAGESAALAAQEHGLDVLCIATVPSAGEAVTATSSPGWPSVGA